MTGGLSLKFLDRDDDNRSFTLPAVTVTAANHDAQLALALALQGAIEDLSLCGNTEYTFRGRKVETGTPKPTNAYAQVNIEWLVKWHYDNDPATNRTVRIPGANLGLTAVLQGSSNLANLAQAEMAAFVTAFQDYVTEDDGIGTVTVDSVEFLE